MISGKTIVMRACTPERASMLYPATFMQHQNPAHIYPELITWDPGGAHWNLSRCRNLQLLAMKKLRFEWTIITDCDCSIIDFVPDLLAKDCINKAFTDDYHGYKDQHCSWWAIHDNVLDLYPGLPWFDEALQGSFWQDIDWWKKCENIGIAHVNADPEAFKIFHHPHEHGDPNPEKAPINEQIMKNRYG